MKLQPPPKPPPQKYPKPQPCGLCSHRGEDRGKVYHIHSPCPYAIPIEAV